MRATVLRSDPGFDERLDICATRVFLNGALVTHTVTADEEAGYVLGYERMPDGKMKLDPENPERFAYFKRRGDVRIEPAWHWDLAPAPAPVDLSAHLRF